MPSNLYWESNTSITRRGRKKKPEKRKDASVLLDSNLTVWMEEVVGNNRNSIPNTQMLYGFDIVLNILTQE